MNGGALAREVLEFLLPAGCVACGTWLPRPTPRLTCPTCRSRLRTASWPRCPRCHHPAGTGRTGAADCRECRGWPPELARARYAHLLEPPADRLVHALKYEGWRELAEEMAEPMASLVPPETDRVVPVPTTLRRLRQRGYNQADVLARAVADRVRVDPVPALRRRGDAPTQVALHPSGRRANVQGAFVPESGHEPAIRGARVVLVDDVLTTGSTAGAAAETLVRMGAASVTLITFARALPHRRPAGSS